jgi:hypothetical protein
VPTPEDAGCSLRDLNPCRGLERPLSLATRLREQMIAPTGFEPVSQDPKSHILDH